MGLGRLFKRSKEKKDETEHLPAFTPTDAVNLENAIVEVNAEKFAEKVAELPNSLEPAPTDIKELLRTPEQEKQERIEEARTELPAPIDLLGADTEHDEFTEIMTTKKPKKEYRLTPEGRIKMLQYKDKLKRILLKWASDVTFSDDRLKELDGFALFLSLGEFMADRKGSKKKYWMRLEPNAN